MPPTLVFVLWLAQGAQRARAVPLPPVHPAQLQAQLATSGEPLAVLDAEKAWAGPDVLLALVRNGDPIVRRFALRALGRLEDPAVVPQLLLLGESSDAARPEIADAIARSLHGFDPQRDPPLIARVYEWLHKLGSVDPPSAAPLMLPIGKIVYANAGQLHGAEAMLRYFMERTANDRRMSAAYAEAGRSLESLARLNRKVARLENETSDRLNGMVRRTWPNDDEPSVRRDAFGALVAGGTIDRETEQAALKDDDWQVRRLAVLAAIGTDGSLDETARADAVVAALEDTSPFVRYEAVKGYVRRVAAARGCVPLLDRLDDHDSHVALSVIDTLGTACRDDEKITERLVPEVRTPPVHGPWQRQAHAFVAIAKRAPDVATLATQAFATHPVWWVRRYAVDAAVVLKDLPRLERLAYDDNDNVRDAALQPLRRLKSELADAAILAALERKDYQLVKTAADLLKDSPPDGKLSPPLLRALRRIRGEGKETSRDVELALLAALNVHAAPAEGTEILPLASDSDPKVADSAAVLASRLLGKTVVPQPRPILRGWPQEFRNLRQCVHVELGSGAQFDMEMLPEGAPIAIDRFLKLALKDHYYDGLTFHRVVPNFVVQGGSPGANEYSGAKNYMRDEIALSHTRGTVGLSTRGRNTGDAQFFINLVDNRRLDDDYTVFARVLNMDAVDRIEEGEEITQIRPASVCPK